MILLASGQCGNQLGHELLTQMTKYSTSDASLIFNEASNGLLSARAVCLDTEPKVIHSCLQKTKSQQQWRYDDRCMLYRHGGAGNNWALGYSMFKGDFLEDTLNAIRFQLELSDEPNSFLCLHSIGGGTGSGLGSKCTEAIADAFPDILRINLVVAPYNFGEVVVQYYNTLLCLSHLTEYADAVLLYENETAYALCKDMRSIHKPLLQDINEIIAKSITPLLLRKAAMTPTKRGSRSCLTGDVLHLCSHPSYRFCTVYNTPLTSENSVHYTHDAWISLLRTIGNMHSYGTQVERGAGAGRVRLRHIGAVLTLRGADVPSGEAVHSMIQKELHMHGAGPFDRSLYAAWMDSPIQIYQSSHHVNGYHRSASALCNGQAILPILNRTYSKAELLFEAGAYIHQYQQHGVDENDFVAAFQNVGQCIVDYNNLCI